MSVKRQDWQPERGESDAKRHRDLVKESVKKRAVDTISDTPIVGKNGKVRVKIFGKKSYSFRHGQNDNDEGLGNGEGDVGDEIGRSPMPDEGEDGPGDKPGEWQLETEIDLAEILDWLTEELGLPKLKKRETAETSVRKTWKPSGVKKFGIPPRLKKKLTVKQAIKRYAGVVLGLKEMLKQALGQDPALPDNVYGWAWNESFCQSDKAIEILKKVASGELKPPPEDTPISLNDDDLRFKKFEEDIEYESNAVLFAIMDVSGSMDAEKKLLARSFYWWTFNFLRTVYENVKIVFIIHHTEAKVTSEDEFFHTVESGGTYSYTGFELAKELIKKDFPPERWNVYAMYFSDGEDFDEEKTIQAIQEIAPLCNALGYAEVDDNGSLLKMIVQTLELKTEKINDDFEYFLRETEEQYFMAAQIFSREDVWPLIKAFFRKSEEVS